ncbi:hypothetical protein ACFLZ4_01910 [Patescibacteria group bacterium]
MPKVLRTSTNPYGLTYKQRLVVKDIACTIKRGEKIDAPKSHMKIYRPKNKATAAVMSNENLNRPNFMDALIQELEYQGILGVSGKVIGVLTKGLDAYKETKSGLVPDFLTRLEYIQEILRICGI